MRFKSFTWTIGILQFLTWINIIAFILMLGIFLYSTLMQTEDAMLPLLSLYFAPSAIASLISAILFYITTKGLLLQKQWARIITIILGVLMLFGFPVGTIIGIILIYGTTKGWPEQLAETTNKNKEINNLP